jgi:caffeoyl-CoA O-methyltransferase
MSSPILTPEMSRYLDSLVPARPAELVAMEAEAARIDFPIIGPAAGQFCYVMARAVGARSIFELGSGFGYSTSWFARAVVENGGGSVHHTVWDADLSKRARRHLAALGLVEVVHFHEGEAVAALTAEPGPFDLIFCDIDKAGYPAALPVIKARLRSGGVLITDNVLWSGRVLDEADRSEATDAIRRFTRLVADDADWAASIVPIRDGLLVARRR